MADEDFDDFSFIVQTAQEIRARLLEIPAGVELIERVTGQYNETQQWPEGIHRDLEQIIEANFDPGDSHRLTRIVRGIVLNQDCPENDQTFYEPLFYEVDVVPEEIESEHEQFVLPTANLVDVEPIITLDRLRQIQDETVMRMADTFSISKDCAWLLLVEFQWKSDALMQAWGENSASLLARIGLTLEQVEAGIPLGLTHPKPSRPNEVYFCDICMDGQELKADEVLGLPCKHYFCKSCWQCSLEGRSSIRRCPMADCNCRVLLQDVYNLCGPEKGSEFEGDVIDLHIQNNAQYKRCTRPTCPYVLTYYAVGLCQVATCLCRQRICWRCGGDAHSPLSCRLLSRWAKITEEESMQAKWIVDNTKPCPRCHLRIEKNGGCNHMTCRTQNGAGCRYEFCWVCGHEWHTHVGNGYQCNKFTDYDTAKPGDLPEYDLKRLNHYYARYINHVRSQEVERGDKKQQWSNLLRERFKEIDEKSFHGDNDTEPLLDDIFDSIATARSVLIWSYPHAFYMTPGSADLNIFEHVQREVERILEELTDLVENKPETHPIEFRRTANVLAANTNLLNKHVDSFYSAH